MPPWCHGRKLVLDHHRLAGDARPRAQRRRRCTGWPSPAPARRQPTAHAPRPSGGATPAPAAGGLRLHQLRVATRLSDRWRVPAQPSTHRAGNLGGVRLRPVTRRRAQRPRPAAPAAVAAASRPAGPARAARAAAAPAAGRAAVSSRRSLAAHVLSLALLLDASGTYWWKYHNFTSPACSG